MRFIVVVRLVMAAVWLYNGLWLKLIAHDPEHLAIVTGVAGPEHASSVLTVIGVGETLLAVGIASGIASVVVNLTQIAVLVGMNAVGIASGGVAQPIGLVVQNLPLVCCALVVIVEAHARRA